MSNENERELGWDDEIQNESEFTLLPEGEYDFEVISFERARYAGGDKLPPCNQAKLKLRIETPEGITTTVSNNLFLHSRTEGLLSAFFNCIGQKKHGEKVQMNWGQVVGAKGRALVGVRTYNEKEFNEIKRFLDPVDAPPAAPATGKGWTPGKL